MYLKCIFDDEFSEKTGGISTGNEFIERLADKSLTPEQLLDIVKQDFRLLPQLLEGVSSSIAGVRYGCSKVLMELSEVYPEKLYPYMGFFIGLLDSEYRILTWNALAIVANLTKVDREKKFDAVFDKYYGLINDGYMVTVANVVGHSGEIAIAKPYLADRITNELLKVDDLAVTPHLTEECKRVIAEKTIQSFDMFFDKINEKEKVISFAESHVQTPRKALNTKAEDFLRKWR
jgi:hypothetical protein